VAESDEPVAAPVEDLSVYGPSVAEPAGETLPVEAIAIAEVALLPGLVEGVTVIELVAEEPPIAAEATLVAGAAPVDAPSAKWIEEPVARLIDEPIVEAVEEVVAAPAVEDLVIADAVGLVAESDEPVAAPVEDLSVYGPSVAEPAGETLPVEAIAIAEAALFPDLVEEVPVIELVAEEPLIAVEAPSAKSIEEPVARLIDEPIVEAVEEVVAAPAVEDLVIADAVGLADEITEFVAALLSDLSILRQSADQPQGETTPVETIAIAEAAPLPDFADELPAIELVAAEPPSAAEATLVAGAAPVDATKVETPPIAEIPHTEDAGRLPQVEFSMSLPSGTQAWRPFEGAPVETRARVRQGEAPVEPPPSPSPSKPDRPEWTELIEALRLDIQRLSAERTQPAPLAAEMPTDESPVTVSVSTVSPPPRTSSATSPKTPRRAKAHPRGARPIQDEWGLFDPEQCGFAALLAKLDEVTERNEESSARSV
jgi:hypothetical protein